MTHRSLRRILWIYPKMRKVTRKSVTMMEGKGTLTSITECCFEEKSPKNTLQKFSKFLSIKFAVASIFIRIKIQIFSNINFYANSLKTALKSHSSHLHTSSTTLKLTKIQSSVKVSLGNSFKLIKFELIRT